MDAVFLKLTCPPPSPTSAVMPQAGFLEVLRNREVGSDSLSLLVSGGATGPLLLLLFSLAAFAALQDLGTCSGQEGPVRFVPTASLLLRLHRSSQQPGRSGGTLQADRALLGWGQQPQKARCGPLASGCRHCALCLSWCFFFPRSLMFALELVPRPCVGSQMSAFLSEDWDGMGGGEDPGSEHFAPAPCIHPAAGVITRGDTDMTHRPVMCSFQLSLFA